MEKIVAESQQRHELNANLFRKHGWEVNIVETVSKQRHFETQVQHAQLQGHECGRNIVIVARLYTVFLRHWHFS